MVIKGNALLDDVPQQFDVLAADGLISNKNVMLWTYLPYRSRYFLNAVIAQPLNAAGFQFLTKFIVGLFNPFDFTCPS